MAICVCQDPVSVVSTLPSLDSAMIDFKWCFRLLILLSYEICFWIEPQIGTRRIYICLLCGLPAGNHCMATALK